MMRITLNVHSIGGGTELCRWKKMKNRAMSFFFSQPRFVFALISCFNTQFQHTEQHMKLRTMCYPDLE